jgi:hypothetical protein
VPDIPPVILIIFNRPDTTRKVFEAIRAAEPPRLLVVSDGPRPSKPGEAERCAATRAIIDEVDWDCEVSKDFSAENLGCRRRVASGISWAFGLVDRAIILEDDCVPSPSFFPYCAELLERYAEDERIMMVSGDNQLFGASFSGESYYFSRNVHAWGWATWRRAWDKFDLPMADWPEIRRRHLLDPYFETSSDRYYWDSLLQYVYEGNIDTWDYQWVYSILANNGLSIVPKVNLVRNIGFNADATHTKAESVYGSLEAAEIKFPLGHPRIVVQSSDADAHEARLRASHAGGLPYPLNKYARAVKRFAGKAKTRG